MPAVPAEWSDPDATPVDFIIVGAGAGGAPLAARLAERGYTVLVVEMGADEPPPAGAVVDPTVVPLLSAESTEDPRHALRYFVRHFDTDPAKSTDPKIHRPPPPARRDEEGIFYPRAQGVGGCTVHNAMMSLCGLPEDWDGIAEATGDESWRGERMRAYFERVEKCHYDRPSWYARLKGWLGFGTGWENARHGHDGWLHTSMAPLSLLATDRRLLNVVLNGAFGAVLAGAARFGDLFRALVGGRISARLDPNHWETLRGGEEGIARVPTAVTDTGERSGPRERLLAVGAGPHKSRLLRLSGACVTGLILDGVPAPRPGAPAVRARGVRCLVRPRVYEADTRAVESRKPADDELTNLYCSREVVLCGGAFNSPQLLMLSGVGPAAHLTDLGIPVRVDRPGVGGNLQDRYEVPVTAVLADRFRSLDGLLTSSTGGDPRLAQWVATAGRPAGRRGLFATNGALLGLFRRTSQEDAAPDLFIFALPGTFAGYAVGYSRPEVFNAPQPGDPAEYRRTFTWLILKSRTRSRAGTVRLRDDNPLRRPDINFRSFPDAADPTLDPDATGAFPASRDRDLEALAEGVGYVRGFLDRGIASGLLARHELPHADGFRVNGALNLRKYIRDTAWGHHACGTCAMGTASDPNAVVDSRFRVHGVAGLRVVDASVFPRIPGFFIVINLYMAAEKAADVLAEDHPLPPDRLSPAVVAERRRNPVLKSAAGFEARRVYPAELESLETDLIAARRRAAGVA